MCKRDSRDDCLSDSNLVIEFNYGCKNVIYDFAGFFLLTQLHEGTAWHSVKQECKVFIMLKDQTFEPSLSSFL